MESLMLGAALEITQAVKKANLLLSENQLISNQCQ